jgi:hypothetical protein
MSLLSSATRSGFLLLGVVFERIADDQPVADAMM